MNKELEKLLKQIEDYNNLGELDDKICNKIIGETSVGKCVTIYWDCGLEDEGYLFSLPYQTPDEFDVCIHIPDADEDEYWYHLYELASFKNVKSIVVK